MRLHILWIFLLASCGSENGGNAADPIGLAGKNETTQSEEEKTETTQHGENTPVENNQNDDSAMFVLEGGEIPPCDKDNKLIYVQAESTFKICNAGNWTAIDLRGPAGTDNKIEKSIFCNGTLEGSIWTVSYSASQMTSGDVFVTTSIGAEWFETSASSFYSMKQNGAATAAVIMRNDAEGANNAGWWKVSLDRTTLIVSVEYNDADSPGGKRSWSMTPDKCTLNAY